MEDEISTHMNKHHQIIDRLFERLKSEVGGDEDKTVKLFHEFKWKLEKHIFLEEKAVFSFCQKCYIGEEDLSEMAADMVQSHDEILQELNDLENKLVVEDSFDLSELERMLNEHEENEDNKLYPVLDKRLDSLYKKIVIGKIKGFPITNKDSTK